jgi:hypothetical protein
MSEEPSRQIRLLGTEQLVPPAQMLRAGELTAELEAGNLRYIRFGGIEMIRAISFIVRDKNWGTYDSVISDLKISEEGKAFASFIRRRPRTLRRNSAIRRKSSATRMEACAFRVAVKQSPTSSPTERASSFSIRSPNWRASKRFSSTSTAIPSNLASPNSSIPYSR